MPVEFTQEQVRDALAVIGERDLEGAQDARAALEWVGWHGEGPLLLRRHDVQNFVWYIVPRKFLASLADKRKAVAALGRLLDELGGRAVAYADVCRSADTDKLLCAWEREDPAAWKRFRDLLHGSGSEPPDTELLAWGQVMGIEEACAREQVATSLEVAIEDGRLAPGTSGFRRRQAQVCAEALREPAQEGSDVTRLGTVHAERTERWLARGNAHGRDERRALLDPVAALVATEPPPVDPQVAAAALEPTRWLLERATDGLALTQAGWLNRALVREVAERYPQWWDRAFLGLPSSELDVSRLHELHALLRRLRLVRRSGRRVVATARGRALRDDPPALLAVLGSGLLAGEDFAAACAELATALILDGAIADFSDDLALRMLPALVEAGWRSGGEHPSVRNVCWQVAGLLRPAEALGFLDPEPTEPRRRARRLLLTDAGRAGLTIGLRARALAPATGPC
jgi:hypothetical protein